MPLQQAARSSPGTIITSMQLSRAVADGISFPGAKPNPNTLRPPPNCSPSIRAASLSCRPSASTPRWRKWTSRPCTPPSWRSIISRRRRSTAPAAPEQEARGLGLFVSGPYPLPQTPSPNPLRVEIKSLGWRRRSHGSASQAPLGGWEGDMGGRAPPVLPSTPRARGWLSPLPAAGGVGAPDAPAHPGAQGAP